MLDDRTSALRVEVLDGGARSTIRMSGELDVATTAELRAVITQVHRSGSHEIVFDLRGLSFLDSSGLGVLIGADLAGRDGQAPARFIRGGRTVQRVFEITGMDREVTWVESG
jgi:anti-sigma B factor antagonist